MLTRPATRRVLALAAPLMLTQLSQTLMTQVDRAMVGRLGAAPLAAMAAGGIIYLVVFLVASALFMGMQAITARRFGEGRPEECGRVLDHGLLLAVVIGTVSGTLGWAFASDITHAVNDDPETARLAGDYLRWRWGGIGVVVVLWAFKGFYFGLGITRVDIYLTVVMNLLNVLFNSMFIYGFFGAPALGLAGAGLASVLASSGGVVVYVVMTLRPRIRERFLPFRRHSLDGDLLRRIVALSGPRALQALAFGGWIFFFKLIENRYGPTAMAATGIVWGFAGIPVLLAIAFGLAAATLVGHRLGASDPDGAEAMAFEAVRLGVLLNAAIGVFVVLFPDVIIGIYTDRPEVAALARGPLRLMGVFQAVDSAGIIFARALSSGGRVKYVMAAEFVVIFGGMIPAAYLLAHLAPDNLTMIWFAWIVYVIGWYGAMAGRFGRPGWWVKRI